MPDPIRITQKLTEQLNFIRRSCTSFDQGHEDEALRIATSLRILFHDTGKSVSLMKHLALKDTTMLSSSRGLGDFKDYLSHRIDLTSEAPIKMIPLLGERFRVLPLGDWWSNEAVFIYNNEGHARKKIILSAANKDGGAHVDAALETYYEILCSGKYTLGITGNLKYPEAPPFPQGITIYPKNAHLALIRQFAHEVLVSASHFNWNSLTSRP